MAVELHINNGTDITTIVVDDNLSLYFWNDYVTPCVLTEEEEFLIENEVDLMGNPY